MLPHTQTRQPTEDTSLPMTPHKCTNVFCKKQVHTHVRCSPRSTALRCTHVHIHVPCINTWSPLPAAGTHTAPTHRHSPEATRSCTPVCTHGTTLSMLPPFSVIPGRWTQSWQHWQTHVFLCLLSVLACQHKTGMWRWGKTHPFGMNKNTTLMYVCKHAYTSPFAPVCLALCFPLFSQSWCFFHAPEAQEQMVWGQFRMMVSFSTSVSLQLLRSLWSISEMKILLAYLRNTSVLSLSIYYKSWVQKAL